MLGELLPTGGGDPIPFLKTKLLVGRRESCDISLRFPNVSSHHCELELINGYWRVRDLGSRNGTKVNGVRIESTWLLPGDELSVAKHSYEVKYSANGEAPPDIEDVFSMSLLEKAGLARRDTITPPPMTLDPIEPTESDSATPPEGLSDEEAALFFLGETPAKGIPKKSSGGGKPQKPPVQRVRQSPPPARPATAPERNRPRDPGSDKPHSSGWQGTDDE